MLRAGGQQFCPVVFVVSMAAMTRKASALPSPLSEQRGRSRGHPSEVVILFLFCFVLFLNRRKPLLLEALRILWKRLVSWAKL